MTNGYAQNRYHVGIGDFVYNLDDDVLTAEVICFESGSSAAGPLVIPSHVTYEHGDVTRTYTVYSIRGNAFEANANITSLSLPNTLTNIGGGVFHNCTGLTGELVIPSSVTTIGASAFENCSSFTGVLTIPPSVTVIESNTFGGCTGFSSIV